LRLPRLADPRWRQGLFLLLHGSSRGTNRMNLRTERGIQAESKSQFDRHAAAACILMLMVVLVVGATGYAGVRRTLRTASATASVVPPVDRVREADPARIASAAVALALIAALMMAIAVAPERITVVEASRRRDPRDSD
jgi:ABC-type Fe3+ transport system permease subunit